MKMREEIDAVRTLALDPIEVIIVPRLTALVIAVPLLTFIGNISALTAAALVSFYYGGVPIDLFVERLARPGGNAQFHARYRQGAVHGGGDRPDRGT